MMLAVFGNILSFETWLKFIPSFQLLTVWDLQYLTHSGLKFVVRDSRSVLKTNVCSSTPVKANRWIQGILRMLRMS